MGGDFDEVISFWNIIFDGRSLTVDQSDTPKRHPPGMLWLWGWFLQSSVTRGDRLRAQVPPECWLVTVEGFRVLNFSTLTLILIYRDTWIKETSWEMHIGPILEMQVQYLSNIGVNEQNEHIVPLESLWWTEQPRVWKFLLTHLL